MTNPTPNSDEDLPGLIGNFHKTLPHDEYGEVIRHDYVNFQNLCAAIESGQPLDFEGVARGMPPPGVIITPGADVSAAKLTSPLAGAASESHGPAPRSLEMRPAPGILSMSTAAEMVELYWMAVLRDYPLVNFLSTATDPDISAAVTEVRDAFNGALAADRSDGALRLVEDLPATNGALDISVQTLFRCGLKDEEFGPLVSQFFLRDIPYGTQTIDQSQFPYASNRNFLTTYEDWLLAQNTGKDKYGRDYARCNFFADDPNYYGSQRRKISTMRDLARFVNRDALHQAYFNAALFLDAVGAPLDDGNPYKAHYSRQGGFATLGGPDLLTLVSEVASRALKVVWRQKWLVHRRARPEVYGGLVQMQLVGPPGKDKDRRDYSLPTLVTGSNALSKVRAMTLGTYFLPMAFSAGSPSHPAYGAGHATVAGACVTILKAWFDESALLSTVLEKANGLLSKKEPSSGDHQLLQPGSRDPKNDDHYAVPAVYSGTDATKMTVGGELNKIASNVAMGRSMGGVHWRSDNTRSLRLGEQVAIEILKKRTIEYAESSVSFTFTSFDRRTIRIAGGQVTVN